MDAQPPVEIVIVAPPRLGEAARDEAFAVTRIDPDTVSNAPRLDEVLATSPSASLFRRSSSISANATIQGMSLRAIAPSGAGRALVTLEGAPLNDPFGGWVIWSGVPAETIERIDIVRGAGAGPYGAGALTGVIALNETPAHTSAGATVGELGYGRAALTLRGSGLFVAAAGERFDGAIPVNEGRGAADLEADFESIGASARWIGNVPGGEMSLRLGAYDEARGAGLLGADSRARGATLTATYMQTYAYSTLRAQAWAALTDFANTSVAVAADRSSTTLANDQYETPALGLGGNIAYRAQHDMWEWELGADARYSDGETREHFRNLGAGFTRGRVAGGASLVTGLYGELSHDSGYWLFTGGLRVDRYAAFDGRREEYDLATNAPTLSEAPADAEEIVPSARFGVRRHVHGVDLRAAAYTGFRPPTLNELHRPFRVGNDVTEANAALTPEQLYGAEVGIDGEAWSVTVFYNRLDDAIGNVTLGVGPGTFPRAGFLPAGSVFRQRANLGRIEAWGVEADADWIFTDRFEARLAAALTGAEIIDAPAAPQLVGLRPAQAPEATVVFGALWRVTPRFVLRADARWESARWEDDLNTRRLSSALNVDARASWQIANRTYLELAVENLLDAEIETAEAATGIESFAPPRIASIGLRFVNPPPR